MDISDNTIQKELNETVYLLSPRCKCGALRDGDVLLFVCSFVCLSHVKFV